MSQQLNGQIWHGFLLFKNINGYILLLISKTWKESSINIMCDTQTLILQEAFHVSL